MTGDSSRAIDAFQRTLREAALLASRDQLPADRLWSFHEARHQGLELVKNDVQPESTKMAEEPIAIAGGRVGSLKPVAPRIDRGAAATGAGRWDDAGANTAGAIPALTRAAIGPFGADEAVDAKPARRRSPDEEGR